MPRTESTKLDMGKMASDDAVQRNSSSLTLNRENVDTTNDKSIWYWYAVFLEQFPVFFGLFILLVVTGLSLVDGFLVEFPTFDNPIEGFEARGSELNNRLFTFEKFITNDEGIFSPLPPSYLRENNITLPNYAKDAVINLREDEIHVLHGCPLPNDDLMRTVFETSNGEDLLHVQTLLHICERMDELVDSHPAYQANATKRHSKFVDIPEPCPSFSLGHAVAYLNNKTTCLNITADDVDKTKELLEHCAMHYKRDTLSRCYWKGDCDIVPYQCRNPVVFSIFHYLITENFVDELTVGSGQSDVTMVFSAISLKDYNDTKKIYKENFKVRSELTDEIVKVVGIKFGIKLAIFNEVFLDDVVYIVLAGLTVFFIILIYTRSLFLSLCCLLNIAMSVVSAYFAYFLVFRLPFFPFFNVVSIILLIGIGADDTFVYLDIWRQNLASEGSNEIHKKKRIYIQMETIKHAFATMFVTSLTTSSALFATLVSPITAIRCFAIFSGTGVLLNFIFTITWLPAVVMIQEKYFKWNWTANLSLSETDQSETCLAKGAQWLCAIPPYVNKFFRSFFHTFLPKLVQHGWLVWLCFISVLTVGSLIVIFVSPKLKIADTGNYQLFRDDDLFEKYDNEYLNLFGFETNPRFTMVMYFIWGVEPTDNGNKWDPGDKGIFVLDDEFDIASNESQEWLLNFCSKLREEEFYQESAQESCFIENFRQWMARPCYPPYDTCCGIMDFPYNRSVFNKCIKQSAITFCPNCSSAVPGVRFNDVDEVNAVFLSFQSSRRYSIQFNEADTFWKEMKAWFDERLENAPRGMKGGWAVSAIGIQLQFYDVQSTLITGLFASLGSTIAAAAAILLLTTRNIILTTYAVISMAGTLFMSISLLVLIGWKLNVWEVCIMSLLVGLSVDFAIHYGVAYRLAPHKDRHNRSIYALQMLSSAITGAALSTFLAGAVMLSAKIMSYINIGQLLVILTSISWLQSTFYFMSFCYFLGPNGKTGEFSLSIFKSILKSQKPSKENEQVEATRQSVQIDKLNPSVPNFADDS